MAETSAVETGRPTGNIYDLGYRSYLGERLGRRHAFLALLSYSLRAVFGLGRSTMNKVFPIGIAILILWPAIGHLAVASLAAGKAPEMKPYDFSLLFWVEIGIALFCAVVAPELVGRDQRNRALPLYFSRALRRTDYVTAKVAAALIALLLIELLPQAILVAADALATDAVWGYIRGHVSEIPPTLAMTLFIGAFMASISLAIAAQTPRRALGTGVVLAYFVIFTALGNTLVATTTGDVRLWVILISPTAIMEGTIYWIFGLTPPTISSVFMSGLAGWVFFAAGLLYIGVTLGLLYRRYLRMVV